MSDKLYVIKDSTLTALGDAVRNKTGKYIGGFDEPILEPFVDITIDTTIMEPDNGLFKLSFDLTDYMDYPYLYFTYEYETNQRYYANHASCYISWGTVFSQFVEKSEKELTKKSSGFFPPRSSNPTLIVDLNSSAYEKGATVIFNLKLWFCDSSKKFYKLNTYTPLEMADAINGLMAIPDEAFNITGSCKYRFAYGGWDWLINLYGDKITTNSITETGSMFYQTGLKTIPFNINIASNTSTIDNIFTHSTKLEVVPYIIGPEKKPPTNSYSGTLNIGYLFNNCHRLRYIPEDYFWKIVPNKDFWETQANLSSQGQDNLFGYCHSLRKLPDISMIGGNWTSGYSCIYYNSLSFCYSLDEATNIPVYGTFSSNAMSNLFYSNYRLKDFTFAVNEDGTPKTANWKNQTIETTNTSKGTLGYGGYSPTSYNAGITADKEVKDDATYQALKNDPDWYSRDINYSRYNHNSAVNTINSLPDTSAYGTNTIKFKGQAGALTDGGAINTLTEEEIAVATAKGWTVSLV